MRLEKESMNVRDKTNMLKLEIKRKNMERTTWQMGETTEVVKVREQQNMRT